VTLTQGQIHNSGPGGARLQINYRHLANTSTNSLYSLPTAEIDFRNFNFRVLSSPVCKVGISLALAVFFIHNT